MMLKKLVVNLLLIGLYLSPIIPITASTVQITIDGQTLVLPTTTNGIENIDPALDSSMEPKYTPGGEITTPVFQAPIKASDLVTPLANSANMYTINRSGRYYVANDLSRNNPSQFTGCTMIYINSGDVTLDLNGKTLRPSQFVNASSLTAIEIAANLANITIRNGTINGYNSLAASPTTSYITTGIDATAGTNKNLSFYDLQVLNLKANGIDIASSQALLIKNVTVSNCVGTSTEISGLNLSSCSNVQVLNCNFNSITASSALSNGVRLASCNTVLLDGCTAADTGTGNGWNAQGFRTLTSPRDITFLNCTATRTTGYARGFSLESTDNSFGPFKLVNCSANQGVGTGYLVGFYALSPVSFENCIADSNACSGGGVCYGFELSGALGSKLTNCLAINNSAVSGNAIGIFLHLQ
ncbi:MAG TPA: right-handed parallel beta-helix repeat-containing protein, partial [Candidatus Babeliales bacterium]|nr:right-handed parallel beta-helix repeat-containing protein [Candidatus Babeliales bacterium]